MLEDDGRPVVDRFTEPVKFRFEGNKGIMCLNDVLKAIVRGGLEDVRRHATMSGNLRTASVGDIRTTMTGCI